MLSVFVLVVVIIIYSPTSQHFISLQEPCYLSYICNHTWISECGFDKVHSHRRKFLDECDRFEYNCDHRKGYLKTEMSECEELDKKDNKTTIDPGESKTSVNVKTYSNDTTITSAPESKSTEPTKCVIDVPNPSNLTTVTKATFLTTKSLQTTSKNICMICTRPSENQTLICNNSAITSATPETMSTETSAEASTTTSVTTITDTTIPTISSTVTAASTTINSSTISEETTKIDTTTTTQATIVKNASTLTEASTPEVTTTLKIEERVNSTIPKLCSAYPKDCDRPTTWETTVEGETRDFFQILKERFGRRAIVMKHTTHFPKHKSLNENLRRDAAFLFGNHIEKHR